MTFLNPYALWSAAVLIPALLSLYFLKLRRVEVTVSSTFLWRRSIQDLQVNSLFQRLRRNILLFLQLLFLVLVVLALSAPGCEGMEAGGRSVIILVDVSASMAAEDVPGGRLEAVKAEAVKLVRGLWTREEDTRNRRQARPADEAMVIAFADRTEIVCPFTRDLGELESAVAGLQVRHAVTNLPDALEVVRAQAESRRNAPHLYLLTDGKVGRTAELELKIDEIHVITPPPVDGKSDDNLGFSQFAVRRNAASGDGGPQALAELVNASAGPVSATLRVTLDGKPITVETADGKFGNEIEVEVPGRSAAPGPDGETAPGRRRIDFRLPAFVSTGEQARPISGVVAVELSRKDSLALDDKAWDVLPPTGRPRCLLATAGPTDPVRSPMVAVTRAMDFADFEVKAGPQFQVGSLLGENGQAAYDLVIFDGFAPEDPLPPGRYLFFGAVPPLRDKDRARAGEADARLAADGEVGDPSVRINFIENHPLLSAVRFDEVSIFRAPDFRLPAYATCIAQGIGRRTVDGKPTDREVDLIGEIVQDGSVYVIVAFNVNPRLGTVVNTDWWVQPGFAVFMQNAILHLARGASPESRQVSPGRPLEVTFDASVKSVVLTDPAGRRLQLKTADGRLHYADTTRVGVYTVTPEVGEPRAYAVNLFDRRESDIAPVPDGKVMINHAPVDTSNSVAERRNDGWWWLLMSALALLMAEWYIYNRKVHI
jgi:hypothetical protein